MIVILMGVSGSGKTTVGELLAAQMGCGFSDADAFHSAANKAKMHAGTPLTDDDRWPWLAAIRAAIEAHQARGEDHVFTCSALKAVYRDILGKGDADVHFVYLKGSAALLAQRLAGRSGHFFDPHLLDSQLATLEEPADAITVDIAPPPADIVTSIQAALPHAE
ncbi:Thermoresistant gluconokinase [Andreprevotia sp. IGB-42]|uniref:gluconokinase n=1 Tax=Andreprevotia sp. IGB-42 TaxID=2497473 RepID=UPI00135CBC95|nr:gluconokinase [Andreprevotia sp. IGB-42]KAF0814243.1 Thermoresistant gluconokinase [Andreprevotia sp. IGB-42]